MRAREISDLERVVRRAPTLAWPRVASGRYSDAGRRLEGGGEGLARTDALPGPRATHSPGPQAGAATFRLPPPPLGGGSHPLSPGPGRLRNRQSHTLLRQACPLPLSLGPTGAVRPWPGPAVKAVRGGTDRAGPRGQPTRPTQGGVGSTPTDEATPSPSLKITKAKRLLGGSGGARGTTRPAKPRSNCEIPRRSQNRGGAAAFATRCPPRPADPGRMPRGAWRGQPRGTARPRHAPAA